MPSFERPPQMEVPKEIERKFTVRRPPENLEQYPSSEIIQGYIAITEDMEVRLRQDGDTYYQTVKTSGDLSRGQPEAELTKEQYETFWPTTAGKRLEKTRYKIPLEHGRVAEYDIYHGELEGLETVEVEFDTEEQAESFVPPEWFGADVTKNKGYKNKQLAVIGMPEMGTDTTDEPAIRAEEKPAHVEESAFPDSENPNEEPERPNLPEYGLEDGVDELTRRIAELKYTKPESVVVLVAGGSASGKTSQVAERIVSRLGDEAVLMSMDNYYRGATFMATHEQATGEQLNWDQPEAVDLPLFARQLNELKHGGSIEMPKYDMKTGERLPSVDPETGEPIPDSTIRIDSRKVIVVEGLFALNDQVIGEGDIKAFVEVGTHGRVMRRLMRDAGGRTSQTPSEVLAYFAKVVEPMNEKYIDSTEKNADLVILNEYDPEKEAKGMLEVQLKFPGTIAEGQLRELGAERLASLVQRDLYYQPRGRDFQLTGESVRIREENGHLILTYKGPKREAEYRERPKIEFEISADAKEDFERMYGQPIKTVSKSRDMYQIDGVVFTLDSVHKEEAGQEVDLGQFVEIRTVNNEESIGLFMERLGLDPANKDKRPYAEM